MDRGLEKRIANLFGVANGHSSHPLDEYIKWIIAKHPELVNQLIDEIKARKDLTNDDLPAAYMAAGTALLFAGSQFFFDVVTGIIYGKGKVYFPTGEVLHNLEQVKTRAHELVDQTFDQYKAEFLSQRENDSDEDDSDEEDDSIIEHDWEGDSSDLEDQE